MEGIVEKRKGLWKINPREDKEIGDKLHEIYNNYCGEDGKA
jgi:hypothetical protein